MKRIALALLITLAALPAFGHPTAAATLPKGVPKGATEARVWGWLDGDKLKVRIGDTTEELLMIGVDAPEPENRDGYEECFAKEATDHLRTLIKKKQTVYLEADKDDRDGTDRLLRYVWVPGEGNDAKAFLLNTKMVRDGYAGFDRMSPNAKYDKNLQKAQDTAKENNTGLWADCGKVHYSLTFPGFNGPENRYLERSRDISLNVGDAFSELLDLTSSATIADFVNDGWISAVAVQLAVIKVSYDEILDLSPPPALETLHGYLVQALALYDQGADHFAGAIDNLDAGLIDLAGSEFSQGAEYINLATAELDRLQQERQG